MIELSPIGTIVKEVLLKTTEVRPNVSIDEWVIMPNHVHVIVAIDSTMMDAEGDGGHDVGTGRGHIDNDVGTGRDLSLHDANGRNAFLAKKNKKRSVLK